MQVLTYNQDQAVKAGGGDYITEGGAYVVTITEAKYEKAKTGTDGLVFTVKTDDGLTAQYLRVFFAKAAAVQGQAGEPIKGGVSMLNAMMGLTRVTAMTAVDRKDKGWHCPELEGKKMGLFLQKVIYTKNDGSQGYKFEIVVPFNPVDKKTMREVVENKPAQTIDRMLSSYKDKVESGNNAASANSGSSGFSSGTGGYADDPGAGGW